MLTAALLVAVSTSGCRRPGTPLPQMPYSSKSMYLGALQTAEMMEHTTQTHRQLHGIVVEQICL